MFLLLLSIFTVIIVCFCFDAVTRQWFCISRTTAIVERVGNGSRAHLIVVYAGAFSDPKFQLEPVVSTLRGVHATIMYITQTGDGYDHREVDKAALSAVKRYFNDHRPHTVTFIGTSMGAGRGCKLAVDLHSTQLLTGVTTRFIAIDGVGSPDDLAGVMPFVAKYLARLPFGRLWNAIPLARFLIQPSKTSALPEWEYHRRKGLASARATKTASLFGQLRAMGATYVKPSSLAWCHRVIYICSSWDTIILRACPSVKTWREAAHPDHFTLFEVNAQHTDYEASGSQYALLISSVLT